MGQLLQDTRDVQSVRPARTARQVIAAVAGVAAVALAAQVSVPLPFTPVPWTLQPMAVLIVGGLLGPAVGAASLALYLALGSLGLPIFAAGGVPGLARLIGPTGGYLLAYPLAAFVVGWVTAGADRAWRVWLAVALGLVVIHGGGVSYLGLLHGDWSVAVRFGTLPFVVGDVVKVAVAALLILRFAKPIRARL